MRATLIHNPRAGHRRHSDSEQLVADLSACGWTVRVIAETGLEDALTDAGAAVVVAGGDGTVGRVAKRLAGTGIPMAVIPTGTANNVARALGMGVDARAAIASLRGAVIREVDLGVVTKDGEPDERFLEGFGVGLFAWLLAERATNEHKPLRKALGLFAQELEGFEAKRVRVELDGNAVSAECLLVCVLNLQSFGPALGLAPDARFDDGLLDVVLVRPEHRASLLAHLRRAAFDGDVPSPRFDLYQAKHVRMSGHFQWAHIDDRPHELVGEVDVGVQPRAVRFLVPRAAG